jgi:hypothetical protein
LSEWYVLFIVESETFEMNTHMYRI